MPGGDLYEISDNGGTLSGGQRTRVALARALYQVRLLLKAFLIIFYCFSSLADKDRGCLVIVATHDRSMLARADEVIVLGSDGKVLNKGVPEKIFCTEWSDFDSVTNDSDCDEDLEHIILQEEEKQAGTVKALVVRRYIEATGRILTFFIIAALFLMQFSKNAADWWLSRWTQDQHNSTSKLLRGPEMDRSLRFLTIYAAIAAANTVFTLIRAFLFAYGGILAAKYLHFNLLRKLLMTSMSWWDRTPSGRVINRICSDVYTCDDSLPFQLNILLASLFNLAGTLVITVMGLPYMLPVFVVLLILYYFIQRYYRFTTVELKRLASLSLSPLYSHYGDTVNGLPTIRAQRFVERFAKTLRERLTMNMRAQYSSIAADQWLSVRLSIISLSVVTVIALMSVIEHELNGVDTGMIALALTYALSLTSLLNGLLGSLIETEKEMVSVERIDDYLTNVTQEDSKGDVLITTSDICGNIEFCNVSLRYNSYLPLALENVNISIQAGQKVAIMGRTGSGKSSLLQALLRIVNIEFGQIRLDGLDITSIPLNVLRRVFGVVPQHPFIFSGSLYENLVVGYDCVDRNEVATMARAAQLESLITRIGGLEGQIEEGGKNLSFGERQIISICRVLLAKCKIVLIDEATSHLDETMHNKIMSLIIKHLPNATIICVTHVLYGLSEFDTVIEMANGRVISQKPPSEELLNRMQT
ncbi:ABC transporter, ATP-binding protein [Dictyocaulus viviparus]|uniref:ABC transporter, ATP-binding protein n=1 Tax=Dictyocaulus viviparus TaxID=29172 RepID=A0A0D8XZK0_DICVI|nr:ABC transporter, ATP-binding protein [Dictyocaulus viviparus]